MERLTVRLGEKVVYSAEIAEETLTLGRTPDNAVVLEHTQVSRHHAELRRGGQDLLLTDLGSTNGTSIEGTRLLPNQPARWTEDQTCTIGPFQLTWQTADAEEAGTRIEGPKSQTPGEEQPAAAVDALLPSVDPPDVPLVLPEVPARPSWPLPVAAGPRCRYLRDLPMIFEEDDFFNRFLLIFETLWEPLERRQDQIAMYFDPQTCPAALLPWLATWLGLEINPHWPEIRKRRLLAEMMELYRWRGTRYGLSRLLEICTGATPTIIEFPEQPFLIEIRVPLSGDDPAQRDLVERLIQTHKPAHVGYTLHFHPPV